MDYSIPVIFLAGIGTFLTPCVLPLIPIYIGTLAGATVDDPDGQPAGRWRMLRGALTFVIGFTVVFVALGSASSLVGKALASYRMVLTQVGGLLVFLFGLKMLKVLNIGLLDREFRIGGMNTGSGFWGNLLFGMVFALGWTPCIGPVLGSVLTYTAGTTSDPLVGGLYLLAYAAGFAVPLLLAAVFLSAATPVMDKLKFHMHKVEVVGGVSLVAVGLLLLFGNMSFGGPAADKVKMELCPPERMEPIVMEIKSKDCPICRSMDPVVDQLKKDCRSRRVWIRQVVVEEGGNRAIAKKFRVIGYPTFLFLDQKGQEVARLVGRQSLHTLRQHLTLLTGFACPDVAAGPGSKNLPEAPWEHDATSRPGARPTPAGTGGSCADDGLEGSYCTDHSK